MTRPAAAPAPAYLPPFRPRFPWVGGDLQTVRNYLVPGRADLSPWPGERVRFPMADGTGDELLAMLHRPDGAEVQPLVVLVHGLTGCEESFYVRETARFLLSHGFPVLRLNLRGAGPSRAGCAGHYSAASNPDLAAVLESLRPSWPGGLVPVGYSLGGSILLRHLAQATDADAVLCAVAVSVPLDLAATARRMMSPRNALYHRWLLARMKAEATDGAARVTEDERRAIDAARTVYAFDDDFVAPRNGFDGAEDYYVRCSAAGFVDGIATPTLIVHGRDDPWIPAVCYDAVDWQAAPGVTLALANGGGHVGFHGQDRQTPWHNLCALAFIRKRLGGAA